MGASISAEALKARWVYNELRGERWRGIYPTSDHTRFPAWLPFEDLSPKEVTRLARMLSDVRPIMPPEIDRHATYRCEAWTQDQIRGLYTIPHLGPDHETNVLLPEFAAGPPTDDPGDARIHAARVPRGEPFQQNEPIIVLDYGDKQLLIEGYLRCLLFLRPQPEGARILVWRPCDDAPKALVLEAPKTADREAGGRSLCLNMIVKNEMANIERCLASVAPFIDCWVIGDTGSTDGTQDFIRQFFAARGIPGELHEFPFINFGQARNEALSRARASALPFDYLLFTDADMELVVEDSSFGEGLTASAYRVIQRASGLSYWNTRLLKRDGASAYKGVTHEFVEVPGGETHDLTGLHYIDHATGSNRGEKVERDARLLREAIGAESDRGMVARYTFYLANTLKDGGRPEEAIEAYRSRVAHGGWMEEIFISLWNIGRLQEGLERPVEDVLGAYEQAAERAPWRAEALHSAARLCRNKGLYDRGYEYARRGLAVAYPTDSLFVYDWVYDYGLLDELAVNAFWCGRHRESLEASERLLSEGKLPADQRERIEKNKAFAQGKLAEPAAQASDPYRALLNAAEAKEANPEPDEVVAAYMEAFAARPDRAEALHHAARFCRNKGLNDRAYELAARGLTIAKPAPEPGLEDWVYDWGLRQEISIAANYSRDAAIKDLGFAACDWLALDRTVPTDAQYLALSNLHFYVQPASALLPSFSPKTVDFQAPEGFRPTNPSITRQGDRLVMVQRTVNHVIDFAAGENDPTRYATRDGSPIQTRNFLVRLDGDLNVVSSGEIQPPIDLPPLAWADAPRGFEDMRLFAWNESLWATVCVREFTSEGWCEQILARIDESPSDGPCLREWRVVLPEGERLHEKNWMPVVEGDALKLVRHCDPTTVVDDEAHRLFEEAAPIKAGPFRGGSQLVAFDGGWLALIHEARVREGQRFYRHRFVRFDKALRVDGVSRPFFFEQHGIEFAAGLAWHPDERRLIVSYGVGDESSRLATVEAGDVRRVISSVSNLPSGHAEEPAPAPLAVQPPEPPADPAWGPVEATFRGMAPFLAAADSPRERLEQSREFDARIAAFLDVRTDTALPQVHTFYEVLSENAQLDALAAVIASQRAAGHPVKLWTYTPERLEILRPLGVELCNAADVVPRALYDRIMARTEIRYFSDVFRYAVLYEHGGLWLDSDIVMLRPFPFRGDYFFNLQWHPGARAEHFVCGNVIYAKPFSRHIRRLYEGALAVFYDMSDWVFGEVGPKLLSDYIASDDGEELRQWVFSPTFFNPIDWIETDTFDRPLKDLPDFLHDERVVGVHLWTARNQPGAATAGASLIGLLSDVRSTMPRFADLADRFNTDKNRHTGNRHCYARVYDRLLSSRRLSMRNLMEIGLCRPWEGQDQSETPSVSLWQSFFPFVRVTGVDITDFSSLNNETFKSFVCDQSKVDQLRAVTAQLAPGSFDVIIDDGSHASHDEQLTLREFFPLLADGGWYFLEDLDWQPPGEDPSQITLTKDLLREIKDLGAPASIDPFGIGDLAAQFDEILFFDSHYEIGRAQLMGGLVAIRKRGGSGLVR